MSTIPLTPAQHAILDKAIHHSGGRIDWFPDNIKGGARKKVLDGLFKRALITPDGEGWKVAAEGYDALGKERPHINARSISQFEANLDAVIANAEAAQGASADTDGLFDRPPQLQRLGHPGRSALPHGPGGSLCHL